MEKEISNGILSIKLENDLTATNVRKIEQGIKSYVFDTNDEFSDVELDLSNVENIDSVGISFLIIIYKLAEKKQKTYKLININENVESILRLMKLDETFGLK